MSQRPEKIRRIEDILRDENANLLFDQLDTEGKLQYLQKKDIAETYFLHPNRMYDMRGFLENFVPPQWLKVFAMDCIPYKELVLEFFSTFHVDHIYLASHHPAISFKLGGQMRYATLTEFARRLELYTKDEIEKLGIWYKADKTEVINFWDKLAENNEFRVSYFKDSRHMILHQLITASLFGIVDVMGNPDTTDKRIMYSFGKNQYLCPIMYIIYACEELFPARIDETKICGGKFVTKLAASYNFLTDDFISRLTPVGRVHSMEVSIVGKPLNFRGPDHKFWVLVHDILPVYRSSRIIHIEDTHAETSQTNTETLNPMVKGDELAGSSSAPEASSSKVQKGKAVIETPDFPQEPAFLESLLDLTDFPDISHLETHINPYFDDLWEATNPKQTLHLGDSSSQQGAQTPQEIPQPAPVPEQPPLTLEDVAKEMRENFGEIRKDLANLTTWLMNRFSDP